MVAVALSRRHTLLSSLGAQILGFDNIRELYVFNEYFSPIYARYGHKDQDGLYIAKGYLFKEGRLCIPQGSIRKLLVSGSRGRQGMRGLEENGKLIEKRLNRGRDDLGLGIVVRHYGDVVVDSIISLAGLPANRGEGG